MDAKLVVVNGNATKNEIKLKLPMTIGRVKEAGLSIAHPMVSRLHCKLYEANGALVIEDNKSANGTYINDQRISKAVLRPGDKLTVGPLTFVAIYRHNGRFPAMGGHPPEKADGDPSLSDKHLQELINSVQAQMGDEHVDLLGNEEGAGDPFKSLLDDVEHLELNFDDSDVLGSKEPQPQFAGDETTIKADDKADNWGVLDPEDDETTQEGNDADGGGGGGGGESFDLNSFFQSLTDGMDEDSLNADKQDLHDE